MRWLRASYLPLLRVDMGLTKTRACLLIVLGGCMGVYWLPLRHLEGMHAAQSFLCGARVAG